MTCLLLLVSSVVSFMLTLCLTSSMHRRPLYPSVWFCTCIRWLTLNLNIFSIYCVGRSHDFQLTSHIFHVIKFNLNHPSSRLYPPQCSSQWWQRQQPPLRQSIKNQLRINFHSNFTSCWSFSSVEFWWERVKVIKIINNMYFSFRIILNCGFSCQKHWLMITRRNVDSECE